MTEDVKSGRGWWSRLWEWVKAGGGEEDEEENWVRGNWRREWECLASTFGAVVGMGNVWGIPFHIYKFGSAFLVPFLFLYLVVGMPALMLHQSVGQFTSRGPGHAYRFLLPAAEGLGWTHLYNVLVTAVSYNNFNTYNLFYLVSSLDNPWHRCEEGKTRLAYWANPNCLSVRESQACVRGDPDQRLWAYGTCYNNTNISELFERLLLCVFERAENGEDPSRHDCGISLNFNFTNYAPRNLFFKMPIKEYCKKPLFKKMDECNRIEYKDHDISTGHWYKGKSGKYRMEFGTGLSGCQDYSERQGLELREACVRYMVRAPGGWKDTLWYRIIHYCNATNNTIDPITTNVSCARHVISISQSLASAQFFKYHLNAGDVGDTEALGWNMQVMGCFLGSWFAILITCAIGPRWIVRLFPITIAFPILTLFYLLIVCILSLLGLLSCGEWTMRLEKAWDGVEKLYRFSPCVLLTLDVWAAALAQVLFSLSLGQGFISTLSSYSRFNANLPVVTLWTIIADLGFSFIASVAMFGIIGHVAHMVWLSLSYSPPTFLPECEFEMDMDVLGLLQGGGMSIAYQTIGELISSGGMGMLGVPFYGTLLVLGLETQNVIVEVILTWAEDTWTWLRFLRRGTATLLCFLLAGLAVLLSGRTGVCVSNLVSDIGISGLTPFNLLFSTILLAWVHGPCKLLKDCSLMTKHGSKRLMEFCFDTPFRYVLMGLWLLLPVAMMGMTVVTWTEELEKLKTSSMIERLVRVLLGLGMWIVLMVGGAVKAWRTKGWAGMWRMSGDWGPALNVHRAYTSYAAVRRKERTTPEALGLGTSAPHFLAYHLHTATLLAQPKEEVEHLKAFRMSLSSSSSNPNLLATQSTQLSSDNHSSSTQERNTATYNTNSANKTLTHTHSSTYSHFSSTI